MHELMNIFGSRMINGNDKNNTFPFESTDLLFYSRDLKSVYREDLEEAREQEKRAKFLPLDKEAYLKEQQKQERKENWSDVTTPLKVIGSAAGGAVVGGIFGGANAAFAVAASGTIMAGAVECARHELKNMTSGLDQIELDDNQHMGF